MNTTSAVHEKIIDCVCEPSLTSIFLVVVGIICPLIISEVLPFVNSVVPKGIIQGLILSCKGKEIITPRNSLTINVQDNNVVKVSSEIA